MLELIGTIVGNILSLPGVLGLAVGLATRSLPLSASLGGLIGLLEALTFADFDFAQLEGTETLVSVGVGILFACLGTAIRRKGVAA